MKDQTSAYLGSAGLASTLMALVGAGDTESPERLEFLFFGGDFAGCLGRVGFRQGDGVTGGSGLEVLSLRYPLR